MASGDEMCGEEASYRLLGGGALGRQASRWRAALVGTLALCALGVYLVAPAPHVPTVDAAGADYLDDVLLPIGRVRGMRVSINGTSKMYHGRKFRGIPYGVAKRWEVAKRPEPWKGVLDATHFRPSCMRPNGKDMSEDCLHLNIYQPIPSNLVDDARLKSPVIVWFHGGSYMFGAGSDTSAEDVERLVIEDRIVVVTINYRLGAFGFMGSRRHQSALPQTGNFGTLDQQLALKWVNDHIHYFDGDKTKVTVLGWSAGAASASVHLSMPSSLYLFARVIMLSGGFTTWAAQSMEDAENDYEQLLNKSHCANHPACWAEGPPCPCLLALTPERLNELQQECSITWAPTVDGQVVPLHPWDALKQGKVHDMPIIIGSALEDTTTTINAEATPAQFKEYLGTILPKHLVGRAVSLYGDEDPFAGAKLGRSASYWATRRLLADKGMACRARYVAQRWRSVTSHKAFWYLWTTADPKSQYPPRSTPAPDKLEVSGCWPCAGAGHGSDLPFLFDTGDVHISDNETDLADKVQAFYKDFADSADPNNWDGFTLSLNGHPAWQEADRGGMMFRAGYTHFEPELRRPQCDFWDEQHIKAG